MTFILTELSDIGIIMAADSSETHEDKIGRRFKEVNKIIYLPELNIGISTWGDAVIQNKDINSWLKEIVEKFKDDIKYSKPFKNKYLKEFSEYLSTNLNSAKNLQDEDKLVLGLHVAGYTYSDEYQDYRPGVYHVHNHHRIYSSEISSCLTKEHRTSDPTVFIAEETKPILKKDEIYHLRNGIYEEFAQFFPFLNSLRELFIKEIKSNYGLYKDSSADLIKIRAESVANWVRFMCNSFSEARLQPIVGKKVRTLALLPDSHRKFALDEFKEDNWN